MSAPSNGVTATTSSDAALGVVVVLQHGHGDLAAGAHLDDVGAGDRRLVDGGGVGDGDDDDGRHRVGPAVGDLVAERRAGRRAGGDGDEVADAVDLLAR